TEWMRTRSGVETDTDNVSDLIAALATLLPTMLDSRAHLLLAALGFVSLKPHEPELQLLHPWFDSWPGIGNVVAGMARQGYDLELRRYDGQGWRAMFFPSGFEHSLISHAGSAWAMSPWTAVQAAARPARGRGSAGP